MRTIHNYLETAKQRREDGEAGFSLIELIVVVAILGILVAIAIPVFGGIQQTAKQNAANSVAANAVTQAASIVAQDKTAVAGNFANLVRNNVTEVTVGGLGAIDTICATAKVEGVTGTAGAKGACTATLTANESTVFVAVDGVVDEED